MINANFKYISLFHDDFGGVLEVGSCAEFLLTLENLHHDYDGHIDFSSVLIQTLCIIIQTEIHPKIC